MKSKLCLGLLNALAVICLQSHVQQIAAAPVIFTIDPARSVVALSGQVNVSGLGALPITEQGVGSLRARYTGHIVLNLTPPTIQFPSGCSILAQTNGIWQPGSGGTVGSAPADYGGKITISLLPFISGTGYSAGRDIKLDITSKTLPLTNSGFDSSLLVVSFITNSPPVPVMDFRISGTPVIVPSTNGTAPLVGSFTNSPATAWLTNSTNTLILILPVNFTNVSTMAGNETTFILQGQLVATAPASAWPLTVSARTQNGQVILEWPSVSGQTFDIQTTQDFGPWSPAGGTTVVNHNKTTWTGNQAGNFRFYRVVQLP